MPDTPLTLMSYDEWKALQSEPPTPSAPPVTPQEYLGALKTAPAAPVGIDPDTPLQGLWGTAPYAQGGAEEVLPPTESEFLEAIDAAQQGAMARVSAQRPTASAEEVYARAAQDVTMAQAPRSGEFGAPTVPFPARTAPEDLGGVRGLIEAFKPQPIETAAEFQSRLRSLRVLRDMTKVAADSGWDPEVIEDLAHQYQMPVGELEGMLRQGASRFDEMEAAAQNPAFGMGHAYDDLKAMPLYESPFAAALRSTILVERGVGTALRRMFTYEVDEQGRPVDEDDFAYKAEQALFYDDDGEPTMFGKHGSIPIPGFPLPRPFQPSTKVETEESTYRQFLADFSRGEWVDYSGLPKYAGDINPLPTPMTPITQALGMENSEAAALAHTIALPVLPPVGSAVKVISKGLGKTAGLSSKALRKLDRAAKLADWMDDGADLLQYPETTLRAKRLNRLSDALTEAADVKPIVTSNVPDEVIDRTAKALVKADVPEGISPLHDAVIQAKEVSTSLKEAEERIAEVLVHAAPAPDVFFASDRRVASRAAVERAQHKIRRHVETTMKELKVDPGTETYAQVYDEVYDQALDLYAHARRIRSSSKVATQASAETRAWSELARARGYARSFHEGVVSGLKGVQDDLAKFAPPTGVKVDTDLWARRAAAKAAGVNDRLLSKLSRVAQGDDPTKQLNAIIHEYFTTHLTRLADARSIPVGSARYEELVQKQAIKLLDDVAAIYFKAVKGTPRPDELAKKAARRRIRWGDADLSDPTQYMQRIEAYLDALKEQVPSLIPLQGMGLHAPKNTFAAITAWMARQEVASILHNEAAAFLKTADEARLPHMLEEGFVQAREPWRQTLNVALKDAAAEVAGEPQFVRGFYEAPYNVRAAKRAEFGKAWEDSIQKADPYKGGVRAKRPKYPRHPSLRNVDAETMIGYLRQATEKGNWSEEGVKKIRHIQDEWEAYHRRQQLRARLKQVPNASDLTAKLRTGARNAWVDRQMADWASELDAEIAQWARRETALVPRDAPERTLSLAPLIGTPLDILLGPETKKFLLSLESGVANTALQQSLKSLHTRDPKLAAQVMALMSESASWAKRVTTSGMLGGTAFTPGLRFLGNNWVTAGNILTATIGFERALKTVVGAHKDLAKIGEGQLRRVARRMGWQDFNLLTPRNLDDVVMTTTRGRKYTERELRALEQDLNIRNSQVSHEFRDTMVHEFMRAAKVTAAGDRSGWMRTAYRWLIQPSRKNVMSKIAEESDGLFRRRVFREAIREGIPPQEAAQLARESMLDYGSLSQTETQTVSRWILFYTFQRKMAEAILRSLVVDGLSSMGLRTHTRGRIPVGKIRALTKLHQAARNDYFSWQLEEDAVRGRIYAFEGDEGLFVGPADPALDSVMMFVQLGTMASKMVPGQPGSSTEDALGIGLDLIFTPGTDLIKDIRAYGARATSPGRLNARWTMLLGNMPGEMRDYVTALYNLEQVSASRLRPGDPRVGTQPDGSGGVALQFADHEGYNRWLWHRYIIARAGIERVTFDWMRLYTMKHGKQNVNLGYLDDGHPALYVTGLQTPVRMPDQLRKEWEAVRAAERELKALGEDEG